MQTVISNIQKLEFEARIFVSFGIVVVISTLSFSVFGDAPVLLTLFGGPSGLSITASLEVGYVIIAVLMVLVSLVRMSAGSVLTPHRVMAFSVQVDRLKTDGPYQLVRNPIYLADFVAMCGFSLCLSPIAVIMPVLFYVHYVRLIEYEEASLGNEFEQRYRDYAEQVPRLIPTPNSLVSALKAHRDFSITREGLRHNALYVLFVPGFIIAAFTHEFLHAVIIGVPAVVDWAVVHTKLGLKK